MTKITRIPALPEALTKPANPYLVIYNPIDNKTYKILESLLSGGASTVPNWTPVASFDTGELCIFNLKIWSSKTNGNTGNTPIEGTYWEEISKSLAGYTPLWEAGVFDVDRSEVMVYDGGIDKYYLYVLRAPAPFTSVDFDTELAAGSWQLVGGSGGGASVDVATNVDMDTGTNDTRFVSPLKFVYGITTRVFSALKTTAKTVQGAMNELWDMILLKQTVFVGVCEACPILSTDVIRDDATRTLTIATIKGGTTISASNPIRVFTDGSGVSVMWEKATAQSCTWSDTKGLKYFYFDIDGVLKSSDTAWQYGSIATIWRLYWDPALVGSARIVREAIEYHTNTISSVDHRWKHRYGAIWLSGFNLVATPLPTGTPNASGVNTCVSLTGGTNMDDNLPYTVTNSLTPADFSQDLGELTAANITTLNAGVMDVTYNAPDGTLTVITGTRFPFHFIGDVPQVISAGGVITPVIANNFFNYYIYSFQDPRYGKVVSLRSGGQYTSLIGAESETWEQVKAASPTLQDGEVRQLYKWTGERKTTFNNAIKQTAMREFVDLRQNAAISVTASGAATLASNVSLTPVAGFVSDDVQEFAEEVSTKTGLSSLATNTGKFVKVKTDLSGYDFTAFTYDQVVQTSAIDYSQSSWMVGESRLLLTTKQSSSSGSFDSAAELMDLILPPGVLSTLESSDANWTNETKTITGDNSTYALGRTGQFGWLSDRTFVQCTSAIYAVSGSATFNRNRAVDALVISDTQDLAVINLLEPSRTGGTDDDGWNLTTNTKVISTVPCKLGTYWIGGTSGEGYYFSCFAQSGTSFYWKRLGQGATVQRPITSASHPTLIGRLLAKADWGTSLYTVQAGDETSYQDQTFWDTATRAYFIKVTTTQWEKIK